MKQFGYVAALAALLALPALAGTAVYSGDTTGGPLWDRPIGTGPSISGLGPVNYSVQPFIVDAAGLYTIDSVQSDDFGVWDGYLHLYQGSFDPTDQLTGLIGGNDDGPGGIGTSQILDIALNTGTTYYAVTSGFAAGDVGGFTNTISGVGNITLVPEPAALSLLALGALALVRRR